MTGSEPGWREDVAKPGTYREVFSYDPTRFKHPSRSWVETFKREFGMADADFVAPVEGFGGDDLITLSGRPPIEPRHREAMVAIVGAENVADDDASRVRYGHGKSIEEDLALRAGQVPYVPDLVVHPRDKHDVIAIVRYCAEHKIPVIPYGGGSGVVSGTVAERGGIALAMRTHMNKIVKVDDLDQTVTVQPGMLGPDFEAALNDAPSRFGAARAYTCGYFPQSFEISTVGGWVAALGSGQASTYYGDAYDLVVSQEVVTPVGVVRTLDYPATANGPKVNDILKGSEGIFGVIVELTLKVFRHLPENTQRFAFMLPSWQAAVETVREIAQGEFGLPAILRISDPEETELGLAHFGADSGIINAFLRARGLRAGERCLLIGTAEGEAGFAHHVASMSKHIAREHGGMSLGAMATRRWEKGRFADIYLREDIIDFGLILDTLETSVTWGNLHEVYTAVRGVIKERPGTVCLTHASHFYPQGTNLYFILMLKPESTEQYLDFRTKVIDRIVASGGSTSHHHGVGNLFGPWMGRHLGREQVDVLRALKQHFDPDGIMNPGNRFGLDHDEA